MTRFLQYTAGTRRITPFWRFLPLVQCVRSILDRDFAGITFLTANFDHSIVTAIWSLDGLANELMETYRQAVAEKGVTEAMSAPARAALHYGRTSA